MKRLLLFAVLLLAVLAAALAWLLFGRSSATIDARGAGETAFVSAAQAAGEEPLDGTPRVGEVAPNDVAAAAQRQAPGAAREELVAAAAHAAEIAFALEGTVVAPSETPLDELLEVLVFAGGSDPLGRVRDAAEPEAVPDFVARVAVGDDGAYRVEARSASDVDALWLVLRGRYLFAREAVRVELRAGATTPDRPLHAPPFALQIGAWVSGRLAPPADARGQERDLSDAELSLRIDALRSARGFSAGPDQAPEREPRVAADGTFEILGVQPETGYRLGALSERFAARKSEPFDLVPGEHRTLELALPRGARVAGRVVDAAGVPVAGAQVEASLDPVVMGQGGTRVRQAESDALGAFALEAVATGEVQLEVTADGFLPLVRELNVVDGERLEELVLELDRGSNVSGFVRWPDGEPAKGAHVTLTFDMSQMGSFSAFNAMSGASGESTSAASGAFAIAGLGGGPFTVRATSSKPQDVDGSVEPPPWSVRVDGVRPDTSDLELVLEQPIGFDGFVVDELGEPVSEFTIHVRTQSEGLSALGADRHQRAFTSVDGTFSFVGLRAGEWQVAAQAAGFGCPSIAPMALPVPAGSPPLAVHMARLARVSGVVVDPAGAPVAGAEVGRERSLRSAARAMPGAAEREIARSDERGRFTLEGLTPGTVSLVAGARDFAESAPVVIELVASGVVDDVVVALREGGLLVGEIYARDGRPEAGREIMAQRPSNFGVQRWTRSGEEGRFTIEHMLPGSWQIMAMPTRKGLDERESGSEDFTSIFAEMRLTMAEIVDGEETLVQLGAPLEDPVRVHGHVLLDGAGLEGVLMSFVPDGLDRQGLSSTTTKADGAYAVDLPAIGSYLITLQKLGAGNSQQNLVLYETVPEAEDHELDLVVPLGAVSGRVTGPDGAALVDARVTLFSGGGPKTGAVLGGNYGEVRTDGAGRYRISWLEPGRFTVGAGGAALGGMWGDGARYGRVVRHGVAVGEGEDVRLDFELDAPGGIEGHVRAAAGAPVSGATIFVQSEDGASLEPFSTIASDAAGHFRYEGLAPGRYLVSARGATHASAEAQAVDVDSGETARVTLAVEEGSLIVVSTADEDGAPLPAALTVLDERGREVGQLKSLSELLEIFSRGGFSTTEQRIGPLAPGSYRVTATAQDGREAKKPVTLRAGQEERRLNLRLR